MDVLKGVGEKKGTVTIHTGGCIGHNRPGWILRSDGTRRRRGAHGRIYM